MTQQFLALQLADSADACQLTVHDCSLVAKELRRLHGLAQRQWVGLMDEEIALVCAECAASAHNWNDISFARAIEAKLKDKNSQ